MDQPLTRTLFGTGKTQELVALLDFTNADVLLLYNSLSASQRKALSELTNCSIYSLLDDFP